MTLHVCILGAAIWGPGLEGWDASRPVLAGTAPYEPRPSPPPAPAILPATERRRTGPVTRLALVVASEATARSGLDPAGLRSVFASSNGDGPVVGGILEALALGAPGERVVSPTQFHNSVHNAAAGYWSIANGSRAPATCLGAHDATWSAALLKAAAEVAAEHAPVLLVAYDHPLPPPLDALRPTAVPFAAALVLAPPTPGHPTFTLTFAAIPARPAPLDAPLDTLRTGNPAAQCLPLLAALARGAAATLAFPYGDGHLTLDLQW